MKPRFREMTAKYKLFRLQHDPMYFSRTIKTFFNKFIKQGKKARSGRQLFQALSCLRYRIHRPRTKNLLLHLLRAFHLQFILVPRRKGRKMLSVPVPTRRDKRKKLSIQIVFKAIQKRRERELWERVEQELSTLILEGTRSSTYRAHNQYLRTIYTEQIYAHYRWK